MTETAKRLKGIFLTVFSLGLLFGVIRAVSVTLSQKYLFYRVYYLFFEETVKALNDGLAIGIGAGISACLIFSLIRSLAKNLVPAYLEVHVVVKKRLKPLFRLAALLGLAGYLLVNFLRAIRRPSDSPNDLWQRALIALGVVFMVWLFMAAGIRRRFARILVAPASRLGLRIVIIFVCLLAAANLASLAAKKMIVPRGPNVVVIVADALRADHLGCYGYQKPTSPNIDEFARDSFLFETAMSNAPWTKPSIGSLFTSLYPHEHGALFMMDRLQDSNLTLAEAFRNKNYATLGLQKNFCVDRRFNFEQGFQVFKNLFEQPDEVVLAAWNSWLRRNQHRPFFAYVHFMNTHVPFISQTEFDKRFIIGENVGVDIRILTRLGLSDADKSHLKRLYDESIISLDRHFKAILDSLKNLKLWDKTIVVLTADHGEEFWEHGSFEHGHTLYNEVLRVPLVLRIPSDIHGRRIKTPVQLFDLFPSLLSLAGINVRSGVQGRNFAPFLGNGEIPRRPELFFEGILFGAEKKAILKDGWKLIENTGEKNPAAFEPLGLLERYVPSDLRRSYELYEEDKDFSEQNNLVEGEAERASVLKRDLQAFKLSSPQFKKRSEKASARDIEKLKSLGYIK